METTIFLETFPTLNLGCVLCVKLCYDIHSWL